MIDSIHIGRRVFSVNHSDARCLQPRVHRDPHACATRYLMSWHGISKHQNTGEFRRNCRAEYGIVTWRTIYSNAKYYSFRSILLGRLVYFPWTVPLGSVFTIRLHKSIGRKMTLMKDLVEKVIVIQIQTAPSRLQPASARCFLAAMILPSAPSGICAHAQHATLSTSRLGHFKTSEFRRDRNAKYAIVTRRPIHSYVK